MPGGFLEGVSGRSVQGSEGRVTPRLKRVVLGAYIVAMDTRNNRADEETFCADQSDGESRDPSIPRHPRACPGDQTGHPADLGLTSDPPIGSGDGDGHWATVDARLIAKAEAADLRDWTGQPSLGEMTREERHKHLFGDE